MPRKTPPPQGVLPYEEPKPSEPPVEPDTRPDHLKNRPQWWVAVAQKADWEKRIGKAGVEFLVKFNVRNELVSHVQSRSGLKRNVKYFRSRDEIDIVNGGGRKMNGEARKLLDKAMRPFAIHFDSLMEFLPVLANKLHSGGVQLFKEDFFHLACIGEALKFARARSDRSEGVLEFFYKLFLTGTLSPPQVCQFANFLLRFGIPVDMYEALAVPLAIDMVKIRHVYRIDRKVPGYYDGMKRYFMDLHHHLAAFLTPLLMRHNRDQAIELAVRSGNPKVAYEIRDQFDEEVAWSLTMKTTLEHITSVCWNSIRSTNRRLHYQKLVGTPHWRTGEIITPYVIPDPYGCEIDGDVIMLSAKDMVAHSLEFHGEDSGRPCPQCGLNLPTETGGMGEIWKEKAYLHHSIYCTRLLPPYSSSYRRGAEFLALTAPDCSQLPLAYPVMSMFKEFPDVNVDHLMLGNGPTHVVSGANQVVRSHTPEEMELFRGVLSGSMAPNPNLRPVLSTFDEDLYD